MKTTRLMFIAGQRGAHLDDIAGRQMRTMASPLPVEQALVDVVT